MGTHADAKPLLNSDFLSWHLLDLPSCGKSVNASIQDLKEYLDTLNTPFHLVGYSLGGRVAQKMASHQQCLSLTLLSSHTVFDDDELQERIEFEEKLRKNLSELSLEEFFLQFYSSPLFSSLKRKKRVFENYMLKKKELSKQQIEKMLEILNINSLHSFLPPCPVLGLYGAFDLKYMKLYSKLPPHVQVVSVPNSGHVVHFENASFCINILEKFIRDIEHDLASLR